MGQSEEANDILFEQRSETTYYIYIITHKSIVNVTMFELVWIVVTFAWVSNRMNCVLKPESNGAMFELVRIVK